MPIPPRLKPTFQGPWQKIIPLRNSSIWRLEPECDTGLWYGRWVYSSESVAVLYELWRSKQAKVEIRVAGFAWKEVSNWLYLNPSRRQGERPEFRPSLGGFALRGVRCAWYRRT